MHNIVMPQWAIARVLQRGGTLHVHHDIDPKKTALVVIDLQNAFMLEDVAVSLVPYAVEIVPNVNRLATTLRRMGGKVFWLQNTVAPDDLVSWSTWFAMRTAESRRSAIDNMSVGSRGHELYAGLAVEPQDEIVHKHRYSAFLPESSDLVERLRRADIDTVLITGTVTNTCCECSARDAAMLNFRTIMVSDANACKSDEEQNASLAAFYVTMGDVMDTDFAIERLESSAMESVLIRG